MMLRMGAKGQRFVLLVGLLGGIGILDTAILNPAMAAYASSLGADEVLASFIAGLYSVVAIPASLAMGLFIDAFGRRRALLLGLGTTALWVYGYALAASPWHLLLARTGHAISGSLVFPAGIAMVMDTSGRGRLGSRLGLYWILIGLTISLGSSLSAALITSLGFRPLFILVALISLAGLLMALPLPETSPKKILPRASLTIIASSVKWLLPSYASIFSLYFAFGIIVGSLSLALIAGGMKEEAAASAVGIYIALATLTSLPTFYLAGRLTDKLGPIRVIIPALGLVASSQLLLSLSLRRPFTDISAIMLGIAIALIYVASTALAGLAEAKGSSIGLHQTSNIAGIAVAAPLSGILLKYYGLQSPFYASLLVQLLGIAIILLLRKEVRRVELEFLSIRSDASKI